MVPSRFSASIRVLRHAMRLFQISDYQRITAVDLTGLGAPCRSLAFRRRWDMEGCVLCAGRVENR